MMRTNVVLNEKLITAGLKATGLKTRRSLIDYALRELLRHEEQMKLLKLRGKVNWQGDLEASRQGRTG
jgi:Arc/MetJ family transcription regulator